MPFVLDLLRHGNASPAADDAARPLSPAGQRDLERLALHLIRLGWRPGRAFTSPLRRAVESARLVLLHAAPEVAPEVMDALRPEGDPAAVLDELVRARLGNGHALLVGHQPLLGELARRLTGGETPGFSPGDLVRVEFAAEPKAGAGQLLWRIRCRDCA